MSRNLNSLQACPSLQKILVLSFSWCFLHCHGEDEQRASPTCGRVLLILTGTDALLMVFPAFSEGHPSVQSSPQIKCLKPRRPQIQDISILLSEQAGPGTLEPLLWTLRLKRTFYGDAILETKSQSHKQSSSHVIQDCLSLREPLMEGFLWECFIIYHVWPIGIIYWPKYHSVTDE